MKKTNTKAKVIVAVAIFCLVYIILAFKTLGSELHLTPQWTVNISDVSQVQQDSELIPYRLGQNIGYFTEEGLVASRIPYPFKATISDSFYATYGTNNTSTDFFTSSGNMAGTIRDQGFPFFDSDRAFLFLPGGTSFASCDKEGGMAWKYESFAPITAFSSSKGGVVAGLADGTVVSFSLDGTITQKFTPGGSVVPVIIGTAISEDGQTIACVSGQEQQRFVVVQKTEDGHSKVVFHEYLDKGFNSQVLVKFSNDGKTVFYNYNGGLGIVDLEKLRSRHVDVEGKIVQIEESENPHLISVLARKDNTYGLTIIEPDYHPIAYMSFEGNCAFIQTKGDKLFVGRDEKISCLSLTRK